MARELEALADERLARIPDAIEAERKAKEKESDQVGPLPSPRQLSQSRVVSCLTHAILPIDCRR